MSQLLYEYKFVLPILPRPERGHSLMLGGDPNGINFLYTNRNSVIIRNIAKPNLADVYTEHATDVNVAKYSPNGVLIASGDKSGKIRIWNASSKDHMLKNVFHPLMGAIRDISWSPDSQRIVVVGEGRERYGHVFLVDTGTSVGEIIGHSKYINCCDFSPTRPFRIITGSDDNSVAVYEGPPFKFKLSLVDHTRFVQAVRFSPDGKYFISGGCDGRVFLYDALSMENIGQFGSPAHNGGVYGLCWSPCGKVLFTCSADKTCRIWDTQKLKLLKSFSLGTDIDDQQVGCLCQNEVLISVSLSGDINYLSAETSHVIMGHKNAITVLGLTEDCTKIYTGSYDGVVVAWEYATTGIGIKVTGTGHGSQLNDMVFHGTFVYTCGYDDAVRQIDIEQNSYTDFVIHLNSQPRGMDVFPNANVLVIACINEILLARQGKVISMLKIDYEPNAVTTNESNYHLAIGGNDNKLHIYTVNDGKIETHLMIGHLGEVTDCSYSPDNTFLAAGDTYRRLMLYAVPEYKVAHNKEWSYHNARIKSVAWSPNSELVASGSLDTSIIVWSVREPYKHAYIKNAHSKSQIKRIIWLNENTIISTGQDGNIKALEVDLTNFP